MCLNTMSGMSSYVQETAVVLGSLLLQFKGEFEILGTLQAIF